ncbi:MAG: hypothetical protein ACI8QZ_003403, partial [Chlamydiales bacterium]
MLLARCFRAVMAHGVLTWCVLAVMGSVTIFGCVDHFR